MTDQALPKNVPAEQALLGAVLVSPDLFAAVAHVEAADFAQDAHQRLWSAYRRLWEDGTAIDLVTVRTALEAAHDLETVGVGYLARLTDGVPRSAHLETVGVGYLARLTDGVPRSAHLEHYAETVLATARRRRAILAHRLSIQALIEDDEAQADEADRALHSIATGSTVQRALLDANGQLAALEADLERDRTMSAVRLGLPAIDVQIEGVRPGEVLGIMARPGIGKTLVLCHAIVNLVEWVPVACFSLEMPAAQIVRRLVRMRFGLSAWQLRTGRLDTNQYRSAFDALRLDGTPGLTVGQMAARVRRLKALGVRVQAVCVDHLGLIGGDRTMSTYDRVSTQVRELKELAKREDVAVILLIQVNRDSGGDGSRELHLGSARDSGVVEEAMDYILAMRRLDRSTTLTRADREKYQDVLFVKVLKHRHGPVHADEIAYRLAGETLALVEDIALKPDAVDVATIAARAGGRR